MNKFLIRTCLFLFLFVGLNLVFGYIHQRPAQKAIKNKTHKKFIKHNSIQTNKGMYDLIFLGSSRGYTAYNPQIIDSITGLKSFNMCTGAQNSIESYYMLKEILNHQKPKYLVYEMYLPSFNNVNDYYHIVSNASFFSSSALKWEMITKGFGAEGIANYTLPIMRNKLYIKADIMALITGGGGGVKKKDRWISGYLYDERTVSDDAISNFEELQSPSNTTIPEKKLAFFYKLAALCKENGIELIGLRSPFPKTRLEKYDTTNKEVSAYFKEMSDSAQIKFYDFNEKNDDKFDYKDRDFSDSHHMNYRGAQKVSKELGELLLNK